MLLLFDIDGTLLVGGADAHRAALHEALREVHGVEVDDESVATAGRTDLAIMRSLLTLAEVDAKAIDDGTQARAAAACDAYARLCPDDLSARVAPGVPATLTALAAAGHVIALVTGNLEPIARLKLRRAGLGRWFADGPGGFGSDHEDRSELPAVARRRAGRADGNGCPVAREQTVVIGDTPLDVACAQADGVRCVAMTTGPHTREDLVGADVVIDGMGELEAVLEAELAGWPAGG